MCDFTPLRESESARLTREIKEYDDDWHAAARYRVVRSRFDPMAYRTVITQLGTGLTFSAAKQLQAEEEDRIRREPDYRPGLMCNPLALVELENNAEAYAAFKVLRKAREDRQTMKVAA